MSSIFIKIMESIKEIEFWQKHVQEGKVEMTCKHQDWNTINDITGRIKKRVEELGGIL